MTDIRNFDVYANRHNPFAKYDHLNVLPPRAFLEGFMRVCDFARKNKIKLPQNLIEAEKRAYLAINNNQYVTTYYG